MRFLAPVGIEESLGNILRCAREASGITVDDAVYRAHNPDRRRDGRVLHRPLGSHHAFRHAREWEDEKLGGGGAMAAVWMALITGGLVWGGIEAFKRLDGKLSPPVQQQAAAADPAPPEAAPDEPEEKPTATTQPEPPRRAIIVNLPED
ncbi:MAG: hypothetical protein OSA84_00540 [Akkermansiaceae bacterium]|nr:hypothetical protein [Akkermansiaceae bacterium]